MNREPKNNWWEQSAGYEDQVDFLVDLALDLYWPNAKPDTTTRAKAFLADVVQLGEDVIRGHGDAFLGIGEVVSDIEAERRLRELVALHNFDADEATFDRTMAVAASVLDVHTESSLETIE